MTLLVVVCAPGEEEHLTLAEWDALVASDRVLFERPGHPLIARLRAAGIEAGVFDDEPAATWSGTALVCDPGSGRVLDLARDGALVTSGPATAPDALSAAHAAPALRRATASLATLAVVMARLRSDDGCPWDREQTHESLSVHLLEETYEVLDAIESGDTGAELEEELGDLLLQVVFHARLAEQDGRFDLAGVAAGIAGKLINRHPHVFGDVAVTGAAEVVHNWEQIKKREKRREGPFEDIPKALPALLAAVKVQKRAAELGFRADHDRARAETARAVEGGLLGDALFWLVAWARARGIDPEGALREATRAFRDSAGTGSR